MYIYKLVGKSCCCSRCFMAARHSLWSAFPLASPGDQLASPTREGFLQGRFSSFSSSSCKTKYHPSYMFSFIEVVKRKKCSGFLGVFLSGESLRRYVTRQDMIKRHPTYPVSVNNTFSFCFVTFQ